MYDVPFLWGLFELLTKGNGVIEKTVLAGTYLQFKDKQTHLPLDMYRRFSWENSPFLYARAKIAIAFVPYAAANSLGTFSLSQYMFLFPLIFVLLF